MCVTSYYALSLQVANHDWQSPARGKLSMHESIKDRG